MEKRNFVISDIHGCLKTFRYLLEDIIHYTKSDTLYLLGDYIDRGPDSKGVIDYILSLKERGYRIYPLKGNHEQLLLDAYEEAPFAEKAWLRNGGENTLKSFGVKNVKSILSTISQ